MSIDHNDVMFGSISSGVQHCDVMLGPYFYCTSNVGTGSVTVNSQTGDQASSSLTTDNYYGIEATGGPWDNGAAGGEDMYTFSLSKDGGSTWESIQTSNAMGWSSASNAFLKKNPTWSVFLYRVDQYHARCFWRAKTSTIDIRVADVEGDFADNTGSLDWSLCNAGTWARHFGVKFG